MTWRSPAGPYTRPNRLADVLALIQVLALGERSHRSEEGLKGELQGPPGSGESWEAVARAHPEFFRVKPEGTHRISLLSRHVLPKNESGTRLLPEGFVDSLLGAAVDMHDRQVKRAERWTYLIPIWVALIVGVFSVIGIAIDLFFGSKA